MCVCAQLHAAEQSNTRTGNAWEKSFHITLCIPVQLSKRDFDSISMDTAAGIQNARGRSSSWKGRERLHTLLVPLFADVHTRASMSQCLIARNAVKNCGSFSPAGRGFSNWNVTPDTNAMQNHRYRDGRPPSLPAGLNSSSYFLYLFSSQRCHHSRWIRSGPRQFCWQQYARVSNRRSADWSSALDARRYSRAVRTAGQWKRSEYNASHGDRADTFLARGRVSKWMGQRREGGYIGDDNNREEEGRTKTNGEEERKEKKRKEKKRKGKERKGKEKQREQRQSKGLSWTSAHDLRARGNRLHNLSIDRRRMRRCSAYTDYACATAEQQATRSVPASCAIDHCPHRSMTLMRLIGT